MAHGFEEGADGLYTVCIFNAEDCSEAEVNEIFGKFGRVVRVNRHGNTTFIRYQTLKEATECYEKMQNNTRFSVKPGRKKGTGRTCTGRTDGMSGNNDSRPSPGGGTRMPLPHLIPYPSYPVEESPSIPPQSAKVVVIGNLNPKMGQNNVYELCTTAKVPPLHVAMKTIKRPPYPNISYAYVYVRNDKEVDSIVSCINNLKINDYELVVSASEKLCDEGKALLSAKS